MYSETDGFIEACVVLSEKPSGATTVSVNALILVGTAGKILCCNHRLSLFILYDSNVQTHHCIRVGTEGNDLRWTSKANVGTVCGRKLIRCYRHTMIGHLFKNVESFTVIIFTTSANATVVPPSSVLISILDNDCKYHITYDLLYYTHCLMTA